MAAQKLNKTRLSPNYVPTKLARERIAALIAGALKGKTFNIGERKTLLVHFGPASKLPAELKHRAIKVTSTDLKQGKRGFKNVPLLGTPYLVTRGGNVVAAIWPVESFIPHTAPILEAAETIIKQIGEMKMLDDQHRLKRQLSERLDKFIRAKVEFLRRQDAEAATRYEREYEAINLSS